MRRSAFFGIPCSLLLLPSAALASPPMVGGQAVVAAAIVCDTKEQIIELYQGTKVDDGKGIAPIYSKYRQMINKQGEPACNIQPLMGPVVKSVADLGVSNGYAGGVVHAWMVEIEGSNDASGWALYGEQLGGDTPEIKV
jgi:hypothetical protein